MKAAIATLALCCLFLTGYVVSSDLFAVLFVVTAKAVGIMLVAGIVLEIVRRLASGESLLFFED